MHFGDSIFIFLLALVLFGPKKLPEIGRTIGKLLAEFRRASNEFKFQIQEELRNMEDEERKKKLAEAQAAKAAADPLLSTTAAAATDATPSILPPSTGAQVSASAPYATPIAPADPTPVSSTAEPSPTEVIVEPAAPTADPSTTTLLAAPSEIAALPLVHSDDSPEHLHRNTHANGAHPSEAAESIVASDAPAPAIVPGESVHHG